MCVVIIWYIWISLWILVKWIKWVICLW